MKSNFIQRSITGLLFVLLLVGSIVYSPITFVALFSVISAYTTYELSGLLNNSGKYKINRLISSLGSFYLFIAFASYVSDLTTSEIFIPYLGIILYLIISELYLNQDNPIGNLAGTMLTQIYVGLNFALINTICFIEIGRASCRERV